MARYSHRFAETYREPVALGLLREMDEASFVVYLQKFSDDLSLKSFSHHRQVFGNFRGASEC